MIFSWLQILQTTDKQYDDSGDGEKPSLRKVVFAKPLDEVHTHLCSLYIFS